ncbi:MAG TPA: CocE/NonD family hydrolase [Fimbriimonadaceae bacterium]|nr:CocE/NonD family hydrolase [Fimbriimonadaceae bacterium]
MKARSLLLLPLCLISALDASGQGVSDAYRKIEALIPMRDGVKLHTAIYVPKETSRPYAFMMTRTPYSCRPYGPDAYPQRLGHEGFQEQGFIFVTQDVRGRYMSEGDFKWMTPYIPNKRPGQVDESTDTRDTIDWLLKNVPNNNGRVGMVGTSFPGHYVAQALIDPHPALKAASPQAPMADNWLGDDMHHNGAFFLPHAMNFIAGFGKKREGPTQNYGPRVFEHGTPDGYRFFLKMGPLPNANKLYLKDQIALWNEWMAHGDYDAYWQAQNVPQHLKQVGHVAVMTVGGWWDAEDLYGPLAIYRAIEKNCPGANNTIVMGPWYHGSWNGGPGTSLHDITWNTRTGEDFRKLQLSFFNHHLNGAPLIEQAVPSTDYDRLKARGASPDAIMFDVGADRWRVFSEWPPREAGARTLYFSPNESLTWTKGSGQSFVEYLSDPNRPVPNSNTITVGMARSYMIEDQRFVWNRPDVVSFETEPLTEPVTLAGPLRATLHVSTTGTDADFVVKLIDVYPDRTEAQSARVGVQMGGYQMLVRGEPMRAKYRNSWSKPQPLTPGKIEKVEFELPGVMHTFRPGHKIMVQVHSSWFPLMDRNPQRFVNIYQAKESDFQKALHRIYLGGDAPSALQVMRLP